MTTYKAVAQALYRALEHDPFYCTLEQTVPGPPAARKAAMLTYFDYSM